MDYLKLYKKRVGSNGSSIKEIRENEAKTNTIRNMKSMVGYHSANHYNKSCFDDKLEPSKVDIVVRSGASELEKTIMFDDSENIHVGSYVEYKNKTYVIREINDDLILPTAKGFYCNQVLSFRGFGDIPCYTNSSTYGSKGVINQDKFYELDSKTKVYVQRNNITDDLKIGMRVMFAKKYVYKITEFDDMVYPDLFIMVCQRDEDNVMDDFENNIAWNGDVETDKPSTDDELTITGSDEIKIGITKTYTSNLDVKWEIDDLSSVEVVEQMNKTIILKGLKANWITLSATNNGITVTKDIMVYK